PTPGTSSINRWPRARAHTIDIRTTSGLPRIAEASESSKSVTLDSATGAATITAIVAPGCSGPFGRLGLPRLGRTRLLRQHSCESVVYDGGEGRWVQACASHQGAVYVVLGH